LGIRRQFDDTTGADLPAGGAWVTLDPTGSTPPVVEVTEQPIYDGVVKGDAAYLLEGSPADLVRRPIGRFAEAHISIERSDRWTRLALGFGGFVVGGGQDGRDGRGRSNAGFSHPLPWGEMIWSRLPPPGPLQVDGQTQALLWLPSTQRLVTAGRMHTRDWQRLRDGPIWPGARYGYTATYGDVRDQPFPVLAARPRASKLHLQHEFEPLGAALDADGDPWLLAVGGHTGDRYRHAQPFMVRLDPDTHQWTARIDPALPAAATQGAVLDAVSLADGGWIIGGAACDEDREWCLAWVARLDRSGGTVWSRQSARESAMVVRDLHVEGGRVYAAVAGGPYCCQFGDINASAWLWTLDLAGGCVEPPG